MRVRWGDSLSESFNVSNGVRQLQGSVLSPLLFAVYLDELLVELSVSSVGCYWGSLFAGAFAYADDIVLLAPCASALRIMLSICAISRGLRFNANKTQLICFRTPYYTRSISATILFNDAALCYSDCVTHIGHILNYDLNDRPDVIRVIKDMNCKANSILCTFKWADPFIKCFLIKSYCLSLYGSVLWSLSSPAVKMIEVSLNKLLRKIWNLPYNCHTGILHCVVHVSTISNIIYNRSLCFHLPCHHLYNLVKSIFIGSSKLVHSSTGYNCLYGHEHIRFFLTTIIVLPL